MKISDLAQRAGTSARMLRYYESQGPLVPERGPNGYRTFHESDIDRATTIASLIRSGLPTRLIRLVLDSQDRASEWTSACDAEFAQILDSELSALDDKIACLTRSRAAVHSAWERAALGRGSTSRGETHSQAVASRAGGHTQGPSTP